MLLNITWNWCGQNSIQLQYLPLRIYFYNITLPITTILYEKSDLISVYNTYVDNFLPRIVYTVVLPEGGHIGRNML
jgi:hypothetical protein